jgi:hypothetical protein
MTMGGDQSRVIPNVARLITSPLSFLTPPHFREERRTQLPLRRFRARGVLVKEGWRFYVLHRKCRQFGGGYDGLEGG